MKLLMVCGISIGWGMPQFLILSFICNGIYAVGFLWKRKNFHLRFIRLFQYITRCIKNKRLLVYETGEQDSMQGESYIFHLEFWQRISYICQEVWYERYFNWYLS